MIKFKYIVKDILGIHARPAGEIALLAKKFDCFVTLIVNEREYNAKKLLSLMGSGIKYGDEITIIAEGIDEIECAKKLEEKINKVL